jgi:hypothetical protein
MHFNRYASNHLPGQAMTSVCATISRVNVAPQYLCTNSVNEVTCERCMKTHAYKQALYVAFPKVTVVFDGVAK